ncbi:phosphoglycerate kinase [Mycoplasma sp. CAG:877]|nr:phosphoglycerate kinase [Mycoplasma sp. CAG:877]
MKTIKDMDIDSKKVIIRCDFNVPIKDGKIIDDTRIKASLKTINYCLEHNAKIILLSHLGRVKEEADLQKNDLAPVATRLSELLNKEVLFIPKTRGVEVEAAISKMQPTDIVLLQNTRYEDLDGKKESSNDPELGKYWASLGDVFINDAFGTIHRAHASNVGIATNIPSAFGFLIEEELTALSELNDPKHPFIVILGGAKVSDKIGVIENLVTKADKILIGGGMAFTFLKSEGYEVGNSLVDQENIEFCTKMLREHPEKLVLPVDAKVTTEYSNDTPSTIKDITDFEYNEMGLDIGPKTIETFGKYLKDASIVVWNGPLGVYEFTNYQNGTKELLKYLVDNNIKVILGGGDIVAAAATLGYKDKVYHASTGGGATLEYLEGKKLPGIEIIK